MYLVYRTKKFDLDLGDKRPLALFRQIQDLDGNLISTEFLKSFCLQRHPSQT